MPRCRARRRRRGDRGAASSTPPGTEAFVNLLAELAGALGIVDSLSIGVPGMVTRSGIIRPRQPDRHHRLRGRADAVRATRFQVEVGSDVLLRVEGWRGAASPTW